MITSKKQNQHGSKPSAISTRARNDLQGQHSTSPPLRARAATATAVSTWGTNVVRTTGVATSLIATAEEPPVLLPYSNPTRLSVMRSLSASR